MSKISIVKLGRQKEVSDYISTKGSGLIKELRKNEAQARQGSSLQLMSKKEMAGDRSRVW
jgi:hypothetical protein